jgi:hypothetical protein
LVYAAVVEDDTEDRLGSSGVFKVIRDSARKFKRAVTGGDEPSPASRDLGRDIAQAFVAGRFGDIYAMGTVEVQHRSDRDRFEANWRQLVDDRGPLTTFEVHDAGSIDLHFIPGLEEVPQAQFAAFLEIAFSSPAASLEAGGALTIGVVLLERDGRLQLGAIHAR